AYIEELVKRDSLIYGTFPYDKDQGREYRANEYDRSFYPEGIARQLAAMAVPGNLKPKLAAIRAPTIVIHGSEDPFYPVEAGKEIAASIPGAELLILYGMGHSLPREIIPQIVDALVKIST
ncbi:MAG: alpha/beta fold hydrolase, partial [Candidatus Thorarchaeota archaeon]